jgi:hypothetical protein
MAKNLEEFLNDLQNGVYDTEAPKIQVNCHVQDELQ